MRFGIIVSLLFLCLQACKNGDEKPVFQLVEASQSGLHFSNQIQENEQVNMLKYEYLYNGGGVGVGDFNNDGKPDLYFTASLGPNALYLNEGNLRFRDVTREANVGGAGRWSRGVAVTDINNDGLQDIYVCASTWGDPEKRRNLLYVNAGVDPATKIPRFVEMAKDYGIDDTTSTHMAAFFDYDNDGDLDLYLLVNDLNREKPNTFRPVRDDGSSSNTDRLYRNDWNAQKQHAVFTDVSRQSGISWEGYGLGLQILDINEDGWKDVFVSNDYLSGDLLYINNRNGTFTNRIQEYFRKGSLNAMGNDAADINNDGRVDIIETDMAGEDNYRFKMMMNPLDYNWYRYTKQFNFPYQTVRNTLQLNRGERWLEGDSAGPPVFSEIAFHAGVAYTDWSWSPLLADLDQDGYRDLLVTNGLPKDITDNDYISYRDQGGNRSPQELLLKLPPVKTANYVFRNNGDLTFSDKTSAWGFDLPSFSNGMVYVDLDGDGDLEVVTNNINMPAGLWKNNTAEQEKGKSHYLRLQVRGDTANIFGIGTRVRLYTGSQVQAGELTPYRGYLSSVEPVLHFGLGTMTTIDSLVVLWPDGRKETLSGVKADQTLLLSQSASALPAGPAATAGLPLLRDVGSASGIFFVHRAGDVADFDVQRSLPHKFSTVGPPLAVADLNRDGMDDIVVGGNAVQKAFLYFQLPDGRFQATLFNSNDTPQVHEDVSIAVFDADNDQDQDIYLAAGGFRFEKQQPPYQDHLWLNDGKGKFSEAPAGSLPANLASKGVVRAADMDGDGRTDLFVGGRVIPGAYPQPESGYLLHNESRDGVVRFTDVTAANAPGLKGLGLIQDAVWTDLDGDRQPDLVVTGEWMGIRCFKNNRGALTPMPTSMDSRTGWWNALVADDLDGDGDMDLLAGNYGQNGFFRASEKEPLRVYSNDYDGNGIRDVILSHYRPIAAHGERAEFPVAMRDQLAEELPQIKKFFNTYGRYARAQMPEILKSFRREGERVLDACCLQSGWFENKGGKEFAFHPFAAEAQLAPVTAILVADINKDGRKDIVLGGNDEGAATIPGRADAFYGLVLQGLGEGRFQPLTIRQSGLFLPGDVHSILALKHGGKMAIAASQHLGQLALYQAR